MSYSALTNIDLWGLVSDGPDTQKHNGQRPHLREHTQCQCEGKESPGSQEEREKGRWSEREKRGREHTGKDGKLREIWEVETIHGRPALKQIPLP